MSARDRTLVRSRLDLIPLCRQSVGTQEPNRRPMTLKKRNSANRFGGIKPLSHTTEIRERSQTMLYRMNLPTWERWGRGLIGVGLVVLGEAQDGDCHQNLTRR